MKPLRILVCGTNYGGSYLQAIHLKPHVYELAGILARGSDRSRSIAQANGIPLWKSTDDLSADIDLACVVLPAAASRVILNLLDRGIPVLCEHPQTARLIESALRKATARHITFHLNAHFADLSAPQAFLRECQRHMRRHKPALIEVVTADRALYGVLDILRRCLGGLPTFRGRAAKRSNPFSSLTGSFGDIPAVFLVQSGRRTHRQDLRDADTAYLADLRFSVVFPSGTLTLASIAGPVLWNENYALRGAKSGQLWAVVSGAQGLNASELRVQRIVANRGAIASLARAVRTGATPPEQSREHLLEVSLAWEALGRLL